MANHVEKPEAVSKAIPVIDLGGAVDAEELTNQILKAGKEFGCFQLVNHGISDELIGDTMGVAKEFFAMPDEVKAKYESEDASKMPLFSTSVDFCKSGKFYCREYLRFNCYPLPESLRLYPDNPPKFRCHL